MFLVCLVFNGTSTQDRSICANCGRVKPTQLTKDGHRDTMNNSQYVTQCNTVHNKTLQLQKCNNRLSNRMTYLFKYYVSAFTNTKSDHTLPIRYNNFTRWDAVLRHAQDIVWQFTLLHIAQCHEKKVNIVTFVSSVLDLGNSMRIDKRQSIQLCSPHTGQVRNTTRHYIVHMRNTWKIATHVKLIAPRRLNHCKPQFKVTLKRAAAKYTHTYLWGTENNLSVFQTLDKPVMFKYCKTRY